MCVCVCINIRNDKKSMVFSDHYLLCSPTETFTSIELTDHIPKYITPANRILY